MERTLWQMTCLEPQPPQHTHSTQLQTSHCFLIQMQIKRSPGPMGTKPGNGRVYAELRYISFISWGVTNDDVGRHCTTIRNQQGAPVILIRTDILPVWSRVKEINWVYKTPRWPASVGHKGRKAKKGTDLRVQERKLWPRLARSRTRCACTPFPTKYSFFCKGMLVGWRADLEWRSRDHLYELKAQVTRRPVVGRSKIIVIRGVSITSSTHSSISFSS